jgi:hypothetical protein
MDWRKIIGELWPDADLEDPEVQRLGRRAFLVGAGATAVALALPPILVPERRIWQVGADLSRVMGGGIREIRLPDGRRIEVGDWVSSPPLFSTVEISPGPPFRFAEMPSNHRKLSPYAEVRRQVRYRR